MKVNNIFSNFLWRFLERGSAQIVTFLVSILLARLLEPSVFGTISLILVFTAILQVFVDSGLGNALIQKKDSDEKDFSTVFVFSLLVCVLLYTGMFLVAPYISDFYAIPELTPIIRVLSLTIIISGVRNIQQAYISKHLQFKKFYIASIVGTIISSILAVLMAYSGFGVWAIVVQHLTNLGISTIILWAIIEWKPTIAFSFNRLKRLLAFGWKLLVSSLVQVTGEKINQLLIGKYYSRTELAFFNNGDYYPYVLTSSINTALDSVMLPVMSAEQDNRERVKAMTKRAIKTCCFFIAPLMIGFALTSKNLVLLILTEKWLPCVPYIIIFCIANIFRPMTTANLNAIKALGRSDLILKLEIIKFIISVSLLFLTLKHGVVMIAVGQAVAYFLFQVINAIPNKKLLDYSFAEQFKDISPIILAAFLMGCIVYFVGFIPFTPFWVLILQFVVGGFTYISFSYYLKLDSLSYIKNLVHYGR